MAPYLNTHAGYLVASDLHAGLWGERNTYYSQPEKARAFRAMVQYAIQNKLQLLLNGDIYDERRDSRKDGAAIRDALKDYPGTVLVKPGNHDDLTQEEFTERLGPCIVQRQPFMSLGEGVVAAHGHELEVPGVWRILGKLLQKKRPKPQHVRDPALEQEMQERAQSLKSIDWLEEQSIVGRRIGERVVNGFRRMREGTVAALRRMPGVWRMSNMLHRIGHPTVSAAAHLGLAAGGTAIIGHLHYPGIFPREVWDPRSNQLRTVTVANSGSFIHDGEYITCLVVDSVRNSIAMCAFDPASDSLVEMQKGPLRMQSLALAA